MKITTDKISDYISNLLPPRDTVLQRMEQYAAENGFPIIGPMVGVFLRQLAYAINAKNILELGSGYGYSAYWFAGGMKDNGRIICTDMSEDNHQRAMRYFSDSRYGSLIDFRVGDALEILRLEDGPFDIILNDIDKEEYPKAFELAISKLRPGGMFITDNVLWSGRILHSKPTRASKAILEFNRRLFDSEGVFSSIIPVRDGLGIAVKI